MTNVVTIHQSLILLNIKKRIERIVSDPDVKRFRIGRSYNPKTRQSRYKFDDVIPLRYESDDERAKILEQCLIEYFWNDPKCVNRVRNSGPFSHDFGNYIYLGLWF